MKNRRLIALAVALALPLLTSACTGTEGRKARFLERGQEYMAKGQLDKARVEFSNALQIDPNDAQVRYFAGRIADKQGKPREALANYQAALEADPDHLGARSALGRIYLLAGMPDKARETIEPGLAKAPDDAQLRTVRGGLRALDGDLAGALEDGEAAVRAAPDDEVARAFLAAQYSRQERTEEAIATLKEGIAKIPGSVDLPVILAELQQRAGYTGEAAQTLLAVAQAHETELVHWQRLARLQVLNRNPAGAEDALRKAVEANPESIEAKSALVAFIGSQKGEAAAAEEMGKFVAADPKNAQLKVAQGQLLEATRQADEAAEIYRAVIKSEGVDPQGLVARNRLASLLVQQQDLPGAEKLIGEVLAENARDNDALILRAGIALSRQETAAAITDLRSVLRDQPNATPIMRALARAHLQDGNAALAEEVLRGAVQTDPRDVQARFDLVSLLTSTGQPKQALPVLEQLIKDAPDNLGAREAYAKVQVALGDQAGARKTAEELKTLRPELPAGAMLLGNLFEKDRKWADATREYEYALNVSNDPTVALASLVRVDMAQKKTDSALSRIQVVIDKAPKLAPAHAMLGEVYLARGDSAKAMQAFDGAIQAQPRWWVPYRNKAAILAAGRKSAEAEAALREGIQQSGALDLYLALAALLESQGKADQVIATYEEALKRNPDALSVANNLAMHLVTGSRDKASIERATQLAERLAASDQPALLDTAGWVKYHAGAVADAMPLLRKAAEKAPQSAEIRYHLGMAELRSGDHAAAKKSLESALAVDAEFNGREDAQAALAQLNGAG